MRSFLCVAEEGIYEFASVEWLEGFHDPEASVRNTVAGIKGHPLMSAGIVVRGFIMDSATGALTEIS